MVLNLVLKFFFFVKCLDKSMIIRHHRHRSRLVAQYARNAQFSEWKIRPKTRDESALTCSVQRFCEKWLDVDLVDLAAPVDMTGWHSHTIFPATYIFVVVVVDCCRRRRRCRSRRRRRRRRGSRWLLQWCCVYGIVCTNRIFSSPLCVCVCSTRSRKIGSVEIRWRSRQRKPYDVDDKRIYDMRTLCKLSTGYEYSYNHMKLQTVTQHFDVTECERRSKSNWKSAFNYNNITCVLSCTGIFSAMEFSLSLRSCFSPK